ncbi:MAG: rRNA (uracil1939-C5)-methyltransferase [Verrucomicrobiota bacterium]
MRTVDLTIEDVAFGGKGVGRENGKAVFVPYTIDGERVAARIVREKKHFAEAELDDLIAKSPQRVAPPCPYFGRCGGCTYQHIDYAHQLELKTRQVREILRRVGRINEPPMRPIIPSPLLYAYRNRITVHALDGVIGFFHRDSHRLIDIEGCPIAEAEVNEELSNLRSEHVRDGHYTLRTESGARIFSQANDAVAELLREHIVDLVPQNHELLIDAFCGSGFFAKRLREKFARVIGIDWDRFAIDAARADATAKENYIAGDLDEHLRASLESANRDLTTLIVDPPAAGLSAQTRRTIVDLVPATFIYVSCNPATLARDLSELREKFIIESVTPFDMFPQTAEIEVAVHLQAASSPVSQ